MFLEICDIHAPYVNIRSKGYTAPWVTDEYLHLSNERDFQRLKTHKENSESAWLLYRETRNKVNNLAKTLKRKYYGSKINNCKNNSAKLWKTLKELLPNVKSGGSINSVVDKTGVRCTENKDIADSFNTFLPILVNSLQIISMMLQRILYMYNLTILNVSFHFKILMMSFF